MADVQFDEQVSYAPRVSVTTQSSSKLLGLVQKSGLAKTDKGAEFLILGVIVIVIVLSIIIAASSSGSSRGKDVPLGAPVIIRQTR